MRNLFLLALLLLPLCAADKPEVVRVTVWPEGQAPLSQAELSAKLDGLPAPVVSMRGPGDDLLLLLVLDLTEDLGLVELAKENLLAAIEKLPQNARVGLLRAQDGLSVVLDPTADRAALKKAVTEVPVSGYAGLLDTVETASRIADTVLDRSKVRVALVYITDSSIYNYRDDYINPVVNASDSGDLSRRFPEGLIREKISKLDAKVARFQAPLFIVHLSYRSDRMNEAYQAGLIQLAASAGGSSAFCRSRAEVGEAISATLAKAALHYSLGLRLPARQAKVVQLQLENGGRTLSYRTRIVLQE